LVNKFDPWGLWGWDGDWVETALKFTPPGVVANLILDYNNAVDFYAAAYSGLEDGLVMAADRYTFSQIDWLNEHSQQLMIEYGTPYEIAYGFSGVSRNAAMMAALAGAGQAVFGLQSVQSFIQAHPLLVTILDYLSVGLRVIGSGAGGYQAGTGIWQISQGDYVNGVYNTGSGGLFILTSLYGANGRVESNQRHYGPHEAGPLPQKVANNFRGGSYTQRMLAEETILTRVYGGSSPPMSPWWSRTTPTGPLQARMDLALPTGNSAQSIIQIKVPAGTIIYDGCAGPQFGLLGGGNQVYIPKVDPSWIVHP
jgi:hypothetical protein